MSFIPPMDREWMGKSLQEFMPILQGQRGKRVLANPFVAGHSAMLHNKTLYDYYTNPEFGCEINLNAFQFYDTVPMLMWIYAVYWCDDFGGKIKWPVGRMSAPAIIDYPYTTPELAEKYEVVSAEELYKGPTWSKHGVALEAAKKLLGPAFGPWSFVYEMFVRVAYLVSPEKALLWVHKHPELVHKLLRKVVDQSVIMNKMVSDKYGSAAIITASLLANSGTMSPKQCDEFNIRYCKEMVEKSLKAGAGPSVLYHLCGDHGKDWPLHADLPSTPPSIMHVAYDGLKPADLTKVSEKFGDKFILLGNMDTALMQRGTPNQVYEESKRMVIKYKPIPRYLHGLACECPPFAPPANVMAFMKAAKDHGKISD